MKTYLKTQPATVVAIQNASQYDRTFLLMRGIFVAIAVFTFYIYYNWQIFPGWWILMVMVSALEVLVSSQLSWHSPREEDVSGNIMSYQSLNISWSRHLTRFSLSFSWSRHLTKISLNFCFPELFAISWTFPFQVSFLSFLPRFPS